MSFIKKFIPILASVVASIFAEKAATKFVENLGKDEENQQDEEEITEDTEEAV